MADMKTRKQYAALPYIVLADHIEVLLITRRRSRRWIIPKGWPEADLAPHRLAELEAYEEAGLKGRIGKKAIGRFSYVKQLEGHEKVICTLDVFPLKVKAQCLNWPEKGQRELLWAKPKKAASLIEEKELSDLIRRFVPTQKTTGNSTSAKAKSRSGKKSGSSLRARLKAAF